MKYVKKPSSVLLIFVMVMGVSVGASAVSQCSGLFRSASFDGAPSQKSILEVQDILTKSLQRQSAQLVKKIQEHGYTTQVDTLVIGSGLHGAIFAMNAGKNNRAKDTLVIESGNVVSKVFGEMAGTFRINSAEFEDKSANVFPGSPLHMKELSSSMFATSLNMATMGAGTMYSSSVPVLFNNKALEVIDLIATGKKNRFRYMVKTSQGISIFTNRIVFATGLGEPSIPLKELLSRKLVENYLASSEADHKSLFPVMTVDAFLRLAAIHDRDPSLLLSKRLEGKTVAVVGKGDGGKIVIEALLNKGPLEHLKLPNLKVKWLGQDAATPAQYRESTWERYFTIADNVGREIETVPGYVEQIQKLENDRIQVIYDGGKATVVDFVLMATGYKSFVPEILSHMNSNGIVHDVALAPLVKNNKVIGSQAVVDGKRIEGIYVTGPAAGKLATPEELAASLTQNPVSVAVLGPFTQALANHLVAPKSLVMLASGLDTFRDLVKVPTSESKGAQDPRLLRLLAKMELQRSFLGFSTNAKSITVEVVSSGKDLSLRIQGLSASSAAAVTNAVRRNGPLLGILNQFVTTEGSISIKIPSLQNEIILADAEFN